MQRLRLIVFLCLCGLVRGVLAGPDYVLVLASYHPGFAWTDGQLRGLRETLLRGSPGLQLRVEYLDAKQVRPDKESFRALAGMLAVKHRDGPPRLIVAQDDDALDLALYLRAGGGRYASQPIVFSGVSASRRKELQALPALTGVFDDADVGANISLLQKLRPNLRRVHFIHDQSRTGLALAAHAGDWQQRFQGLQFVFLTDMTVVQIRARLAALGDGDGVIALAFNRDAEGAVLDHAEAAAIWGAASPVPVLVKEDEMLAPGILGGIVLSGFREGEAAARLALRVLGGIAADSIAMQPGVTRPVFADAALRRFGIADAALPPGAEIVGREPPLRVTHPVEFWVTMTLFAGATLIIPVLTVFGIREARARRAANASERNYREILNAANEGIVIHELDGRILDVNRRFREMFGFEEGSELPVDPGGLGIGAAPYGAAEAAAWVSRARDEGPQLFEWRARHADGHVFWVEVALRRTSINGEARLLAAIRDISGRKHTEAALRDSEARYDLLLSHLPVGVMHFSCSWILSYCNDRFVEIIGAPRESIVGSDMRRLRDPSIMPTIGKALAGEPAAYQGEYTSTASGRRFWLELRAAPVRNDGGLVIGGIAIAEDISERIAAEETRRAFNASLERGIAERTEALAHANEELKAALTQLAQAEKMAALGNLVAGVAHELNTPIGNARMFATTIAELSRAMTGECASGQLRRSTFESFVARCGEAATHMDDNLRRAANLIGNMKQLAVDQSTMQRRLFDLESVLGGVLDMMHPRLERAHCRVTVEVSRPFELDSFPGALEQVLMNLIMNALVHAFPEAPDGTILITATDDCTPGCVTLRFSDNGVGMDEPTVKRAFEPFFTTRLGQGGSGLGLYLVYSLLTGPLGGSIALVSEPGRGTSLTMTIPLRAPGTADVAASVSGTLPADE